MTEFSDMSPIFQQEEVLREEYRPNDLPERTDEMEDLHMSLAPAARGVGANNVFLHGKAGQGKTAAAKAKLSELQAHAEEESDHLDLTTAYVSCESHDLSTSYKTASRIYQELTGNSRPTGYATDVVMDMMFEAMNDIGGTIIIVLDEIDTLGDDDRILYSLPRARAQDYVEDHVYPSIIGISNDLQWRDNLSPKVKSSLYDDSVLFSPYDATQLQQILRRRAAKAFRDTELIPLNEPDTDGDLNGTVVKIDQSEREYLFRSSVLTDDVIPLIAALSAQDTGDARQAIKYLRKAGELADKHGDDRVSADHAREAQALVEREAVVEAMREMTTQAHLALAALTALELSGDAPVRAKPIYGVYKSVASRIDADKLGQRRFKDHLRELDMQGIADGEKVTAGSIGGPAWEYQLQVDTEIAVEVIKDTTRFADIDFERISADRPNA
ncbi:cell division control protein 6 [Halohasta litchfieldiae]|jgi:cell division control protein 6|uniref:ORC1-type DNA replication protein n=1 Tax=Halohasta litchfieldiae TaxID=1073996 RepID=A0A1H6XD12_9EURY|nr:AAA family ATPase [Halohasta litchfieldiae]ATW88341.1 cell division control protein 6 [Halohasta litchfieldiae]SEJ25384.1 cell division control protein 6 [Halohasta litchfieldiae]